MLKQTGSFSAKGNDGKQYTVFIFTKYISAGTLDDPTALIEGMKSLRTSTGHNVTRKDKGKYEIVQTGVLLESASPGAP